MLEKLDSIDWSSLSHAYGEASDVPDIIRALASDDPETREEAISELHGNIWHQGTVYEATPYAVPFLIELLKADTVKGKDAILGLLSSIAEGSSYLDVHQDMDYFFGERDTLEFSVKLAQEFDFVRLSHEAVVEGLPVYLALLSDADVETKLWSLYTLSTCLERAEAIKTALWERFAVEENPQVKASLLLCVRDLWRRRRFKSPTRRMEPAQVDHLNRLAEIMRSTRETATVRFSAALILVGWLDADAREEAFSIVEELADESWQDFASLPWSVIASSPIIAMTYGFNAHFELQLRFQLGLLGNHNSEIRTEAMCALADLCREYRSAPLRAAPALGELLSAPDPEVRWWAAMTLSELGSAARLATEALLAALDDANARVRGSAAMALAKIGEKRAVPGIQKLLQNSETSVKALKALQKFGPLAAEALNDLQALLRQPANGADKINVLLAIGAIDTAGESSLADVAAMLSGPQAGTAAWVLGIWGPKSQPHISELLVTLNSRDWLAPRNAVKALGNIGEPAGAAVPRLLPLLQTNDPHFKACVAFALWQIEGSNLAVPTLIGILEQEFDSLHNDSQQACSVAAESLGQIGAEASAAAAILHKALQHKSVYVRIHAAYSLWQITRNVDEVLALLIKELSTSRAAHTAMKCLAEMGPLAKPAVPHLQRLIDSEERVIEIGSTDDWIDQDEEIQELARKTLHSILGH
jgi:HEAT repeat protein